MIYPSNPLLLHWNRIIYSLLYCASLNTNVLLSGISFLFTPQTAAGWWKMLLLSFRLAVGRWTGDQRWFFFNSLHASFCSGRPAAADTDASSKCCHSGARPPNRYKIRTWSYQCHVSQLQESNYTLMYESISLLSVKHIKVIMIRGWWWWWVEVMMLIMMMTVISVSSEAAVEELRRLLLLLLGCAVQVTHTQAFLRLIIKEVLNLHVSHIEL